MSSIQKNDAAFDDDDDFGDFGGFEAAEPVEQALAAPVQFPGLQASPSPWALFPVGNQTINSQPDLLQAQNTVQANLEPPFPTEEMKATMVSGSASDEVNGQAGKQGATSMVDDFDVESDSFLTNQAEGAKKIASLEEILEPNFKKRPASPHSEAQRRDSSTDFSQAVPVMQLDVAQGTDAKARSGAAAKEEMPCSLTSEKVEQNTNVIPSVPEAVCGVSSSGQETSEKFSEMQEKLIHAEQENIRIQKDLEELLKKHSNLKIELSECQHQLHQQEEKYQTAEAKHKEQMDALRKAGHEALATIVETYEQSTKLLVIQQEEVSQRKLQEAVAAEAEKCEALLKSQHERLQEHLVEEQKAAEEHIKQALEDQRLKQQEEFGKVLQTEREKTSEYVEKAVQGEIDASQRAFETALRAERDKTRQLIEDEKAKMRSLLEEERSKSSRAAEEVAQIERQKCQDCMREAVKEERKRGEGAVKQAIEQSRVQMQDYVKEQRQDDAALRQRQLAGLDLFLESARKQLQLLISDNNIGGSAENKESENT